jgi:hypothetical protein
LASHGRRRYPDGSASSSATSGIIARQCADTRAVGTECGRTSDFSGKDDDDASTGATIGGSSIILVPSATTTAHQQSWGQQRIGYGPATQASIVGSRRAPCIFISPLSASASVGTTTATGIVGYATTTSRGKGSPSAMVVRAWRSMAFALLSCKIVGGRCRKQHGGAWRSTRALDAATEAA